MIKELGVNPMILHYLALIPWNMMELCPKASPSKSQNVIQRLMSWQISGEVNLAMVWNIGTRDQKSCSPNPYSFEDPNERLKTNIELHISYNPTISTIAIFRYLQ